VGAGASRLDRFLVLIDWEELFPESVQRRMARPFSDHFPICLESLLSARGKTLFRFENMWLEFEGFSDLIREWWEETHIHTHTHTYICKCTYMRIYVYIYIYVYSYIYTYTYMYVCICVCVYVCKCVCVYVYMYMYE